MNRSLLMMIFVTAAWCNLFAQNRGNIGQPGAGASAPIFDSLGISIPQGELVHGTGTKAPGSSDSLTWNAGLFVTGPVRFDALTADALDSLAYFDTQGDIGKVHVDDLGISATPAGSANEIQFRNAGAFGADGLFVWDASNDQLGVGIATPATGTKIHVNTPTPGGAATVRYSNSTTGTGITDGFYTGYGDFGYFVNYENTSIKYYTNGLERLDIKNTGQLNILAYDAGAFDATPVKALGLDASENIVTFDPGAGADSMGLTMPTGYILIGQGNKLPDTTTALYWDGSVLNVGGTISTLTTGNNLNYFQSSGATGAVHITLKSDVTNNRRILARDYSNNVKSQMSLDDDAYRFYGVTAATNPLNIQVTSGKNIGINTHTYGTSAVGVIAIANGTAPTTSPANLVQLWAEDVSASSELRVRDEGGTVTTLSPHNFSLIPGGRSESMAWSHYSERDGTAINVDMLKLARLVEELTGEKLVYIQPIK